MAIQAGQRLGPYEILSAIGAGRMGEVYRARDTRLERIVAVKILPDHLSDRAELRERFELEARTIASLNHPHICTLHDIGHQDGIDYLVLEYLEGETLAERLKKGPLPLEQVLRYAVEISDALDKAHRKGITHRDLKPGNIMLTKSGTKLLDFGLAKLRGPQAAVANLSALPTEGSNLTARGTILGTLQYMAPEQLEGKEADVRTDIFAFGLVVYEMATGKKAFEGKSQASLIAKILETDPPSMVSLQPMTPPALDRVVKRCLSKEADQRWQTANDLREELKWIADGSAQVTTPAPVLASGKIRDRVAWLSVVILLISTAALSVWVVSLRRPPVEPQAVRFSVPPPEKATFAAAPQFLTVSPDGRNLAFEGTDSSGRSQLWIRPLDSEAAQALAGTDDPGQPFWSPDSRFLAFYADGKLKKIAIAGGPAQTLADATGGAEQGTWSSKGVILFAGGPGGIRSVSSAGGASVPVTALDSSRQETAHYWPYFLPDGNHFLYLATSSNPENNGIFVGSLDAKPRKLLLNTTSNVVYVPPGYLLFNREGTLMAQPFDADQLKLIGEALPIAEDVQFNAAQGRTAFAASQNGVLAYRTGGAYRYRLTWFDRAGKQIGVLGDPAAYGDVALSTDDKVVSVTILDQTRRTRDIWLYDVARGLRTRFTFDPAEKRNPIWSPDGTRVVFSSKHKGHLDMYQKASSGAAAEELLLEDNLDKFPDSWSPNGKFIMYTTLGPTGFGLSVLPLSGDRKPFPFLNTKFVVTERVGTGVSSAQITEGYGQFSPDGRWVAYVSDESGRSEVYVAPFPGPGGKWQISTAGGFFPRWRRDGTEIFYSAPGRKLMAAAVNGKEGAFEIRAVKPLFQTQATVTNGYAYQASADGQRFLVNTLPQEAASAPITVVLNWMAGLKK